uniref:RHO family interacting cell polarization regulator 2 n=1 Tax=Mus musculus TaxID=10090 RepID=F2Z3V4_MOUSE
MQFLDPEDLLDEEDDIFGEDDDHCWERRDELELTPRQPHS